MNAHLFAELLHSLATIGVILAVMALAAVIERIVPLHPPGKWNKVHLRPNLALTFLTFATNLFLNIAVIMILARFQSNGSGVLNQFPLHPLLSIAIVVVALDCSFYVA